MQIASTMASYSLGEADILRRAMSKKKEDIILKERPKFIKGATDNGYSEELINKCLEENLNLDLRCDLVTKELVDRFHQKGLEVNTWTVDSKEEYERLKKCGVDYITTNILE